MSDPTGYIERATGYYAPKLYKSIGSARSARVNLYGGYDRTDYNLPQAERLPAKRKRAVARARVAAVGIIASNETESE